MNTVDSASVDRNNLNKAHELKEQANRHYRASEYGNAIMLYHKCLLHARAVSQLSNLNLRELAREERDACNIPTSSSLDEFPQEKDDEKFFVDSNITEALDTHEFISNDHDNIDENDSTNMSEKVKRSRVDSTTRGEEMREEARQLVVDCYNNLAACIVNGPPRKREDYLRAAFYCDKVLNMDEENEKAIYRKACALRKAESYEKAIEQFQKCSNNAQVKLQIEECNVKISDERKKRDAAIRANFAKARQVEQLRLNPANGNASAAMNGSAVNGNARQ